MSDTTSPALPTAVRYVRDLLTIGALSVLLVATSLSAQTAGTPDGELIIANKPTSPQVREFPVPSGAAALPEPARRVSAKYDDHGDQRGRLAVAAGPALASLSLPSTRTFSMLGVTWNNPTVGENVTVEVRTKDDEGWSSWEQLHIEAAPAPEGDGSARGGTEPMWVGSANGAQVRVGGQRPRGLELSLIDPGEGSDMALQAASASRPDIITRRQWGADPSLSEQCSSGLYGITNEAVTIHHTVNSNDYAKHESDNLVRGIYAYHTQSNGWCDLGYNFLVDKYGQIFQGRRGWMQKQVQGAHAGDADVNEQSTGISLIGNFESAAPTRAMKTAVVKLAAWRLDAFFRNPEGWANIAGTSYPVVMGHRDVKATACPGRYAYSWLPRMRDRVSRLVNADRSAIHQRWLGEGGQGGHLGWPYIGEHNLAGGRMAAFRRGRIYAHPDTGAHVTKGPIAGAYYRNRGAVGELGFPTEDSKDRAGRDPDGARQRFEGGQVFHHPDTGAHETHGYVAGKYYRMRGAAGDLGFPKTDVVSLPDGGRRQGFQGGQIFYHPDTDAHETHGAIAGKYVERGAATGMHGYPVTDVLEGAGGDPTARKQSFQTGHVFHHPATGAHETHGYVAGKYFSMRGAAGDLGFPQTDIVSAPDNGRRQGFENGQIFYHPRTGAHETHGYIAGKYFSRGAANGMHGYPVSGVLEDAGGDPTARKQNFQTGQILYHPSTGAHEVHGRIAGKYFRMQGAAGDLGFPTTDVRKVDRGYRSDFQGGYITWNPSTGDVDAVVR